MKNTLIMITLLLFGANAFAQDNSRGMDVQGRDISIDLLTDSMNGRGRTFCVLRLKNVEIFRTRIKSPNTKLGMEKRSKCRKLKHHALSINSAYPDKVVSILTVDGKIQLPLSADIHVLLKSIVVQKDPVTIKIKTKVVKSEEELKRIEELQNELKLAKLELEQMREKLSSKENSIEDNQSMLLQCVQSNTEISLKLASCNGREETLNASVYSGGGKRFIKQYEEFKDISNKVISQ